jgi:hypothetical protein
MHCERMRFFVVVFASTMALAGCGGMAGPDRTFPVLFDNSSVRLDQPVQDIVVRASNVARQLPLAAVTVQSCAGAPDPEAGVANRRLDIEIAEPIAKL